MAGSHAVLSDRPPHHERDWINLLGVRISALNLPCAVARTLEAIRLGRRGYICIRDVHGVVKCRSNDELRRIHNHAFLVTPDGMPIVWALKLSGHGAANRVYGPDLMLALFDAGQGADLRHFLFGSTAATLARLQVRLLRDYPGARIVGAYAPPFGDWTPTQEAEMVERINTSGADIVWVGLGTPKQELWMGRTRERLTASMLIGVGAAFDFHSGTKRQAPRVIQRSGLEWLFRLASEPRRLARRYAVAVPAFIGLSLIQATGLRQFPLD